jgi:alpha-L-arabinofuranosidase
MQWCEAVGTEPYLCFNFGTGTLDEGKQALVYRKFSISKALAKRMYWE